MMYNHRRGNNGIPGFMVVAEKRTVMEMAIFTFRKGYAAGLLV